MFSDITIRPAIAADAEAIARIYNYYVATTAVSFEEVTLPAAEMAARVQKVQRESLPWLVAMQAGEVVGYAYAAKWSGRSAYRYSAETTVYLDYSRVGQGIGSTLYGQLLSMLKSLGIHIAIGGIALPNEPSVALHKKFGFEKVAQFREIGFKFNQWIDVGYWEKFL